MTIEISVCNKDTHKHIRVESVEYNKELGRSTKYFNADLAPGCSATFHVHLLRDIVISEVKP